MILFNYKFLVTFITNTNNIFFIDNVEYLKLHDI